MITKVLNRPTNTDNLQREVELLRSFVIGIAGKDKEGEYRPEFVQQILSTLYDASIYKFTNRKTFLSQLRQ